MKVKYSEVILRISSSTEDNYSLKRINRWNLGGSFMVQKVAISSPIPHLLRVQSSYFWESSHFVPEQSQKCCYWDDTESF